MGISWWVKAKSLLKTIATILLETLYTDVFLHVWMFQWAPFGPLSGSGKNHETGIYLCGCHSKHHVWRTNSTAHHPKNITPTVKFRSWEHHRVGLFFSIWYWQTSYNWRPGWKEKTTETFLIRIRCHLPGCWRWNEGGHFSKTLIPNTQPRKCWIGFRERK